MMDVYRHIHDEIKAPARSWNYDSWFYYKCTWNGPVVDGHHHGSAVKNWTAMPDIFPNGMNELFQETTLPVIAHNRWWCNDTDYATRNGGQYNFIINDANGTALPIDDQFWDDLFKNSTAWGLKVYLQDWITNQINYMPVMNEDLSLEPSWLNQMGRGAEKNDINILYCAAMPRQMLQSVEIQNVVSIRASQDYEPSNKNWRIGLADIWTYALGLSPFKDTFWTSAIENGNPAYENMTEHHPELEAAVATFSTGTVGISDKIGKINMTLVNRSINQDGLILKPSRPLAVPDYLMWQESSSSMELETYSEIDGWRFGIVLLANVKNSVLRIENYQFHSHEHDYVSVEFKNGLYTPHKWAPDNDLKTEGADLSIHYTAPTWHSGEYILALVGEMDKWTPVSPQRFTKIDINDEFIRIEFKGAPGESIDIKFFVGKQDIPSTHFVVMSCKVAQSGQNFVLFDSSTGKLSC